MPTGQVAIEAQHAVLVMFTNHSNRYSPIVSSKFRSYDSHLIIEKAFVIARVTDRINAIPNSGENYVTRFIL